MSKDNDEMPLAVQHVMYFLLFAILAPILLSWVVDYGRWLRSEFPTGQPIETTHHQGEKP